ITKQTKPVGPKAATKKPQPAPTKPKEKKPGKVAKKRTLKKSQQLVDEIVNEGIPLIEPGFGDLEADTQRAIKESLKDAHGRGKRKGESRRTSAPTEPSGHDESSSLYAELGLTESDMESDEEVPPVVKSGAPDEGQAGPNPGNDTVSQTLSTPGENLKLTVDDPVIPEDPASSTGTLSSL
ncbi:hypothetical protein Tco_1464652, partial [Tanacetum coccineum]